MSSTNNYVQIQHPRMYKFVICCLKFDIITLAYLQELALDGNPFTSEQSYKQIVIDQLTCLRQLDLKKVRKQCKISNIIIYYSYIY